MLRANISTAKKVNVILKKQCFAVIEGSTGETRMGVELGTRSVSQDERRSPAGQMPNGSNKNYLSAFR